MKYSISLFQKEYVPVYGIITVFFKVFHLFYVSLLNFCLYMYLVFASMHPSFPVFVSMFINGDIHNMKLESSFESFCCFWMLLMFVTMYVNSV